MKIALLTHHWVPNFGANLQALATFSYLSKQGHDVTVLNYVPEAVEQRYKTICSAEQIVEHERFCRQYFKLSPVLRNEGDLIAQCSSEDYDLVLCGSDAVFRLNKYGTTIEGAFPNPYWLTWINKLSGRKPKRAFISVSCTGSMYFSFPRPMKRGIADALAGVDHITVRDQWTRWMLRHVSGATLNPNVTPDPVSVLNDVFEVPPEYNTPPAEPGSYIVFSMHPKRVSESWVSDFVTTCNKNGLQVLGLPFPEMEMPFSSLNGQIELPVSPLGWYQSIRNSVGFVGERFHPTVCSLFNLVPFVAVDHYRKRGVRNQMNWFNIPSTSKVYSVCSQAGAKDNCVHFPDLENFPGDQIFNRLRNWNRKAASEYVRSAKAVFSDTLDQITRTEAIDSEVRLERNSVS